MAEPTDTFPRSMPVESLAPCDACFFLGKANLDIVEVDHTQMSISTTGAGTHRCPGQRSTAKLPVDVTVADLLNRLSEPSNPVQ